MGGSWDLAYQDLLLSRSFRVAGKRGSPKHGVERKSFFCWKRVRAIRMPLHACESLNGEQCKRLPWSKNQRSRASEDVLAAFEQFLSEVGSQRPFVLAGHSQGR